MGPLAGLAGAAGAGAAGAGAAAGGLGTALSTIGQVAPLIGQFAGGMGGGGMAGGGMMMGAAQQSGEAQMAAAREAMDQMLEGAGGMRDALTEGTRNAARYRAQGGRRSTNHLLRGLRQGYRASYQGVNRAGRAERQGLLKSRNALATGLRGARRDQLGALDAQEQLFSPVAESGGRANAALDYELGLGDRPEFWDGLSLTPAGQFRMEQGRDQIEAGASARGGLRSGATLKALEDYRQQVATGDRELQLDRLTGRAGRGDQAINALAGIEGRRGDVGAEFARGLGDVRANYNNAFAASRAQQARDRGTLRSNYKTQRRQALANLTDRLSGVQADESLALGDIRADYAGNVANARATGAIGQANALSGMLGNMSGVGAYNSQLAPPAMPDIGGMLGGMMPGGGVGGPFSGPPMGGGGPFAGVGGSTQGRAFVPGMSMGAGMVQGGNALRFPGMAQGAPMGPGSSVDWSRPMPWRLPGYGRTNLGASGPF